MQYSLIHYSNIALLLVSLVTLALFFATGMYSEKISYAYKFVPQANRALRPFNIYLNTRAKPRFSSFTSYFRTAPPPTPSPPSTSAPLSRRTSASSSHSFRSARGNRSPPGSPSASPPPPSTATRGVPLAPIPPASNPRGELIFSSRVSASFREGYERYRGEWEKRRMAHEVAGKQGWWKWIKSSGSSSESGSEKEREGSAEMDGGQEKGRRERGRSPSVASAGSRPPSRQSSPLRLVQARTQRNLVSSASSSRSSSPLDFPSTPPPSSVRTTTTRKSPEVRVRAESFSAFLTTMDEGQEARRGGRMGGRVVDGSERGDG